MIRRIPFRSAALLGAGLSMLLLCIPAAGQSAKLETSVLATQAGRGPLQVGEEVVRRFETPHPYAPAAPGSAGEPVWTTEIRQPGATYICPHFRRMDLAPGDSVIVRSPDGARSWRYEGTGKLGLGAKGGFWAIHIPGDTAVVELFSDSGRPGAGARHGYTIDRFARGFRPEEVGVDKGEQETAPGEGIPTIGEKSLCGADDTLLAKCYQPSLLTAYDKSRAVARLLINGTGACTGWLVGTEGHLMTNNHCIGSSSTAQNTNFEFMAEGSSCSASCSSWFACPGTVVADSATLVKTDYSLDYTLVKLPTNPAGTYGYLTLRSSGAALGERIFIPQHPQAWGKRIAVSSTHPYNPFGYAEVDSLIEPACQAGGPLDVGYYADTQGGSSGSPVIGWSDSRVVALHHCRGGSACTSNGGDENRGVPIEDIISDLGSALPDCALGCTSADCNGTYGQWKGCRGTGCHVCEEKVSSYELYYFNHPACTPNANCGGLYYTCNEKCPAPTSADVCNGTPGQWSGCRGTGCHVCKEKVAAYGLYFKNHPACKSNSTCGGQYYTCNINCPAPTAADVCNGTPGEWSGCRGTGCHVCEELVQDYPCYFQNHPYCTSNGTCGGQYYTCNENCPAPTAADRC